MLCNIILFLQKCLITWGKKWNPEFSVRIEVFFRVMEIAVWLFGQSRSFFYLSVRIFFSELWQMIWASDFPLGKCFGTTEQNSLTVFTVGPHFKFHPEIYATLEWPIITDIAIWENGKLMEVVTYATRLFQLIASSTKRRKFSLDAVYYKWPNW